jgi:heme exporter protein A
LGGLWKPTKGKIHILGYPPTSPVAKKLVGIVVHENILYDELTVIENIQFHLGFYSSYNESWVKEILGLLGINKVINKKIRELSFGWKRRINIARALLHSPKILIIDEPLTGLDDAGRASVKRIIRYTINRGGTVIVASPEIDKELIEDIDHVFYKVSGKKIFLQGGFL